MSEKPKEETKAKTSIKIDPQLWKDVRIEALREDVQVSAFTERALKAELDKVRRLGKVRAP